MYREVVTIITAITTMISVSFACRETKCSVLETRFNHESKNSAASIKYSDCKAARDNLILKKYKWSRYKERINLDSNFLTQNINKTTWLPPSHIRPEDWDKDSPHITRILWLGMRGISDREGFLTLHLNSVTNYKHVLQTLAPSPGKATDFDFIHFWSVTLVNTINTTSFIPPSVIKFHLLFAHAFTCFGFLVNHLQKAHQLFKGNYHYMIHIYIK
jgi:hypothetical protein